MLQPTITAIVEQYHHKTPLEQAIKKIYIDISKLYVSNPDSFGQISKWRDIQDVIWDVLEEKLADVHDDIFKMFSFTTPDRFEEKI
jgi:hypothetical protein